MIKNIFKEAIGITWRTPGLWFLGFLVTFSFLSLNEFIIVLISPTLLINNQLIPTNLLENNFLKTSFLSLFIIFVAIVFLFFLSIFSEIFIVLFIKKNRQKENLSLFNQTIKLSGRIIIIRFISAIIIFILWGLVLFLTRNITNNLLFISLLLSVLISFIIIILLFLTRYSIFYLILEKNKISQAIKNAWDFFLKNWLTTLKVSFSLFLISLVYGFFSLYVLQGGLLTYPLRLFNFIFNILLKLPVFWLGIVFTAIFVLILQIIVIGFLITYQIIVWLLFFIASQGKIVDKKTSETTRGF